MRYDFGDLRLDTDARQVRRGDRELHLSPKAFDLLSLLIAERHRAVPRQEIYDHLWPSTYVVEGNLPVLVGEIRRALDDRDHRIIRTVHGTGYSFTPRVEEGRAPASGLVHVLIFGNQEFVLTEGENVIGRDAIADVVLPSKSISRKHAVVTVRGGAATLQDLESKNGTFIDTKRVAQETALVDGNVIRFGALKVLYRYSPLAGSTASLGSQSASNS
jgi:DNA-binding winged helix-turn-helix (wHTH) protein